MSLADDKANLFPAILSMDSYNRGYLAGIRNLGGAGTNIGNVTFKISSDLVPSTIAGQSVGFYASAYEFQDGNRIVSYRGTDGNFTNPFGPTGSDLLNGYGITVTRT